MKKILLLLLSVALLTSAFVAVTPVSAASVTPFLLLEGEALLPDKDRYQGGWVCQCTGELDADTGIVRLTALGRDPYYHLLPNNTKVAPVLAIKYRTDVAGVHGKIYSSVGAVKEGHCFEFSYNYDGEWHLKVLDLEMWLPAGVYNPETDVLDHLRYDFIDGAVADQWIEVEYVAFFNTEDEAELYDAIRDGRIEAETDAVTETVAATQAVTETATETAPEVVTEEATEAMTEAVTEPEKTTETAVAETTEADASNGLAGCKSVVAVAAVPVGLAVLAAAVAVKKKD